MKLDAKDKMFQLTREKLDEMTEKYEKEKNKK